MSKELTHNVRDIFTPKDLKPINIEEMFNKCRAHRGGRDFQESYDFPDLLHSELAPQIMGEVITAVDNFNDLYSKESHLTIARNVLQQYGFQRSTIPSVAIGETTLANLYEASQQKSRGLFWSNTCIGYENVMGVEYLKFTRGRSIEIRVSRVQIKPSGFGSYYPTMCEHYLYYKAGTKQNMGMIRYCNDLANLYFWEGVSHENRIVAFVIACHFFHRNGKEST